MEPPVIRLAEPSERERVLATVLIAFSSDPLVRWFWPEAATYLRAVEGFDAFGGGALEAGGAFVTAGYEGAALWMPPGTHPDEERMASFIQETVRPEIAEEVGRVFELMDEYHPKEDVWYLPIIGVDPAHQGLGLGSALMKAALRHCDEAGLPAYLESSNPRNISLYERHGFEATGVIQHGSSPVITPMYRQAQ